MLKVENFRIENIGQRKYSARGFEIYIGPVFRRRFSPKNRGGRDPLAKLRELPARTEAKHGQNFPLKIRYSPRYGKLVASIFFRSNFTTEDRRWSNNGNTLKEEINFDECESCKKKRKRKKERSGFHVIIIWGKWLVTNRLLILRGI